MKRLASLLALLLFVGFITPPDVVRAAAEGDLVKCPDFTSVYYVGRDGSRLVFPNDAIYFTWFADFSNVKTISCTELAALPLGDRVPYRAGTRLVKIQSAPTVYVVSPGGVLHALTSEAQAVSLFGDQWSSRVDDLSDAFFPSYTILDDVADSGFPNGTMIKNADTGTYYYVDENARHVIPAEAVTSVLSSFALVLSAPFDDTTVGDDFSLEEWEGYTKLDQEGEGAPVPTVTHEELQAPTLSVNATLIANNEPYTISWNDADEDDEYLLYELQEDTSLSFPSPTLLSNDKDTSEKFTKEDQDSPKFYYRVRASRLGEYSAWSNVIRVDVESHILLDGMNDVGLPPADVLSMGNMESGSVPLAAATIFHFLDQIEKLSTAVGLSAQMTIKNLAGYLAWFVGLNGLGSEDRGNVDEASFGVYNEDILDGLTEFIKWQGNDPSLYGFDVPRRLSQKTGFNNWTVKELRAGSTSDASAYTQIANSLKTGVPVLGVFQYWNPVATGDRLGDIRFYALGDEIETSIEATMPSAPNEEWRLGSGNEDVGHGVVILGYIPNYDVNPDDDADDREDYVVLYDGWSNTFPYVAVPLDEWSRFYVFTPSASVVPQSTAKVTTETGVHSGELYTTSWSTMSQATWYELSWSTEEDFSHAESFVTTAGDGVTDYVDVQTVSAETTYYYRVRGWNEIGPGKWGPTASMIISL